MDMGMGLTTQGERPPSTLEDPLLGWTPSGSGHFLSEGLFKIPGHKVDLGRVASSASNREVELACDSSSRRGVGQKGVSPV